MVILQSEIPKTSLHAYLFQQTAFFFYLCIANT